MKYKTFDVANNLKQKCEAKCYKEIVVGFP
jgi:hypothetical protein